MRKKVKHVDLSIYHEAFIESYSVDSSLENAQDFIFDKTGRVLLYSEIKSILAHPDVKKVLVEIEKPKKAQQVQIDQKKIPSLDETKAFWGEVMRDPLVDLSQRLKASEYLARSYSAFVEKTETTSVMTFADLTKRYDENGCLLRS